MNDLRRRIAGALVSTILVIGGGCGSGAPSVDTSLTEAAVSGKVTFQGKPLTEGKVTFNPGNNARPTPARESPISKEGTYSVKTLIGENSVEVFSLTIQKAGPDMPPFTIQVKEGENKIDIDLPRE